MSMRVFQAIKSKLAQRFQESEIMVENESHNHAVPPNSETHFKVVIICDEFESMRLITRHRLVNDVLAEELAGPVHALAIHTFTKSQWIEKNNKSAKSPNCLGAGK